MTLFKSLPNGVSSKGLSFLFSIKLRILSPFKSLKLQKQTLGGAVI